MNEPTRNTPAEGNHDTPSSNGKRTLESTGSSKKSDRSKRFRVSRACDQCRAGRERCDGAQPICQTCETQSRTCTYNEPPKKRGIQPNYIRTLELTLAWLFKNIPDGEKRLSQLLPQQDDAAHKLIAFKDAADSEALHSLWRNSIICRQIDQLLSGAEIESPKQSAPGSNQGSVPYQSPPLSAPSESSILRQDANEPGGHASSIDRFAPDVDRRVPPDTLLKLPEDAWSLLEDYFAFTHTWIPITEKHDILRLMYTYPDEGLSRLNAHGSEHAELWSIMAYSMSHRGARSAENFRACQDIAKSLIPRDSKVQLGHVKSLLILSLIELDREAWVPAWLTVGSAVRLLTHLLPGEAPSESAIAESRTKHTYLAAYLLECVISLQIGALSHLRASSVRDIGPLVEDGMEEWSPWHDPSSRPGQSTAKSPARSISTFNELVRIALRSQGAREQDSSELSVRKELGVVHDLIRNAFAGENRKHPSLVISNFRKTASVATPGARMVDPNTPISRHIRTNSSQASMWDTQQPGMPNLLDSQYSFMSIPNNGPESMHGETSVQSQAQPEPSSSRTNLWPGDDAQVGLQNLPDFPSQNPDDATGPGADIFEELAMLERTESGQNPKFMQNLGFGPDLDLAEFFGADYQPSDPLLSYMQPDTFGDMSHVYGSSSKDAG